MTNHGGHATRRKARKDWPFDGGSESAFPVAEMLREQAGITPRSPTAPLTISIGISATSIAIALDCEVPPRRPVGPIHAILPTFGQTLHFLWPIRTHRGSLR